MQPVPIDLWCRFHPRSGFYKCIHLFLRVLLCSLGYPSWFEPNFRGLHQTRLIGYSPLIVLCLRGGGGILKGIFGWKYNQSVDQFFGKLTYFPPPPPLLPLFETGSCLLPRLAQTCYPASASRVMGSQARANRHGWEPAFSGVSISEFSHSSCELYWSLLIRWRCEHICSWLESMKGCLFSWIAT